MKNEKINYIIYKLNCNIFFYILFKYYYKYYFKLKVINKFISQLKSIITLS